MNRMQTITENDRTETYRSQPAASGNGSTPLDSTRPGNPKLLGATDESQDARESCLQALERQRTDGAARRTPTAGHTSDEDRQGMTASDAGRPASPVLHALYSPSKRKIGCAIIAAIYGVDRRVNAIVHGRDWFTAPTDDMTVMSGTAEDWRRFAASAPEQRPGPEHFERKTTA